jgi:hypothetical protein|tara:strand:+ start:44 stop:1951 length:1908 start_codon:yes stop_codon:yes gene_type:complete
MAIKSIGDLTAPVGMTEKENQKGLKITVPLEATNQNREGMDFLANPLMTPTDIDPAYNINEPGPLDYADRFDFEKKTKKPSLINRAIRTGIMLAGPGKFVRGANLLMNAPDIIGGIFKSGKKIKPTNLDDIIEDIGEEKLKTFSKQTDLIKYIKEEYGVDIGKTLISKRIKKGQFSIGDRTKVNEEFVDFFKTQKELVDRIGKGKANNALQELLKLDQADVLGSSGSDLINILAAKGIKATDESMVRLRTLYKRFKGLETVGKRGVSQFINFDDPQVSNIMERIVLGDLKKKDAVKLLEEIYPKSGFVDTSMGGKASGQFSKFYQTYIDQLDDPILKKIATEGAETPRFYFNKIPVGEKISGKAIPTLRSSTIFDDTGKTFTQTRTSFLNNDIAKTLINKTKNLFQDKSTQIFDVDHIQAPRFGGTNAESNLRLITKADHVSLKALPAYKTLASDVVKAKSGFEDEYYKLSTRLIDNVKNNNFEAADKIAESLRVMVNNFKNTYKNVDFVVGAPHVAIKTGDNTAKYIKYGDDVKLSTKQKKYIEDNNLLPTQSNLPNAGKPIEKQAEDIYQGYLQIYNLIGEIPSGSIGKVAGDIKSMDVPLPRDVVVRKEFSGLRDGGIVDIFKMTRPVDAQR